MKPVQVINTAIHLFHTLSTLLNSVTRIIRAKMLSLARQGKTLLKTNKQLQSVFLIFFVTLLSSSGSGMTKYAVTLLKSNAGNSWFILALVAGILLYLASLPIYIRCLSRLKLSVAQPVFSGSMFMYTILISVLIFKESFAIYKIAGFAAIFAGIIIVVI